MATNSCYTCTFASKCLRWYFTPDCSPHASWSHPIKVPCVWCWWQRVGPGHRQVNLHSACIGFFNLQSQPFIYREIRYTVLLNKKIPLPSDTRKEEEVCESWREWRKFYNLFEMLWSLLYRARQKGICQVWWILLLLLLTTSAWACLQHSHNLAEAF